MDLQSLKKQLKVYDQEHLLSFWDELTDDQKTYLFRDLSTIDFKEVSNIFHETFLTPTQEVFDESLLEPLPKHVHESVVRSNSETLNSYRSQGEFKIDSFFIYYLTLLMIIISLRIEKDFRRQGGSSLVGRRTGNSIGSELP